MAKMNEPRIAAGALITTVVTAVLGVVIGRFWLHLDQSWMAVMTGYGRPVHVTFRFVASSAGLLLLVALSAMNLYAAARPRLGAGVRSAIGVGTIVWFLFQFLPGMALINLGLLDVKLVIPHVTAAFLSIVPGVIAGASIYKDNDEPAEQKAFAAKA